MKSGYPYLQHFLCLLPLCALLCCLLFCFGSEKEVVLFFNSYRDMHPVLTRVMYLFTTWGNAPFYLVYGSLLFWGVRHERPELVRFALAYLLAQALVALLLGRILKIAIGRPRPMTGGPFTHFALDPAHNSMPSGHTTEITGACLPLAQRYGRYLLPLLLGLIIAAMGFSRIYLSMHFISDIAGGVALGIMSGYCAWRFGQWPLYWWRRNKGKIRMPRRGV